MSHLLPPRLVLAALMLAPAALRAQDAPPAPASGTTRTPADECYGFAFGGWTPALDPRAAGHRPHTAADVAHAPGGRDWAAAVGTGRDTTLLLFPAWWPAGVAVRFPAGARTPGDTVRGRATALVADGRVRSPEAAVLAWTVSCTGRAPDRGAGIVLPAAPATTTGERPRPAPSRPSRPPRPGRDGGSGASGR